jgi:hypothetical protein
MNTKNAKEKTIKEKIDTDEDFINSPSHRNSLRVFMSKNVEGVDNARISKVLMITEKEVEEAYQFALAKIKKQMATGMD